MYITEALWRELTDPNAHKITLLDAAAIEIVTDNEPSRIGLILELKHVDMTVAFKILATADPQTLVELNDQLTVHLHHILD